METPYNKEWGHDLMMKPTVNFDFLEELKLQKF